MSLALKELKGLFEEVKEDEVVDCIETLWPFLVMLRFKEGRRIVGKVTKEEMELYQDSWKDYKFSSACHLLETIFLADAIITESEPNESEINRSIETIKFNADVGRL